MSANQIYLKTIQFCVIRFFVGLLCTLVPLACLIAMVVMEAKDVQVNIGVAFIIFAITIVVAILAMKYFGYMFKAAQVAVIAQAAATGVVPENPVKYGMQLVKSRYATANVYFAVDSLVSGAVNDIYKIIGKVTDSLSFIPGIEKVERFLNVFIKISLGTIDECCLGYTMIHPEQGAFKSACDGICIYFQNIKTLLKKAAVISIIEIASCAVLYIIPKLILSQVASSLTVASFLFKIMVFIIAAAIAFVTVAAFVDSYILTRMMCAYMEVIPNTVISFNLYEELCNMSKKFKNLYEKAQAEVREFVA